MATSQSRKRREFAMNDKPKDTVATADTSEKALGTLETALRDVIETQPYTAVGIALGIGWLFGRMHRPF
jgi:ElaB/YqjD/DUF883 family membrane-anchored ribosome-binding protein